MPPPRYAFHDSLKLDVDGLSDQFKLPNVVIYRAMCDVLEEDGRVSEAIECFQRLQSELGEDMGNHNEQALSELGEGFQWRCDGTGSLHKTVDALEKERKAMDDTEWVSSEDSLLSSWPSVPSDVEHQTSRRVVSRN